MLKPGWYHTGMDSWDNPEIEYFASGPGFAERNFDHGPFRTFTDAKADLKTVLRNQIGVLRDTIEKVDRIKKVMIFKDLL